MAERIVAVGLLTARDLDVLGSGFRRLFPIDKGADFDELLLAIDRAVEGTDTGLSPASSREDRMPPVVRR